ncbi:MULTISPECIES: flagellar motor protein MotB [Cohnella]|uniref:flagellar motor protein MotB n=1 Tax=Cohnella TaxID=329857 RepID=UPI0009BA72CC|nr:MULTISPECIES: flagellar motor protein MotB [Cohnella]MBN2981310.1 flagellar motor protein MotB [Cohnella algarum]
MSKKRQRHEPHEEHADESWLLPYSDLMTLLLALFIVLYAASSVNTSKLEAMSNAFRSAFNSGVGLLDMSAMVESESELSDSMRQRHTEDGMMTREQLQQQEQENLEHLKQALDQYIQNNGLSTQLQTQLNQSELLITIRDTALFASGEADIKPEARTLAVAIGQMLQEYPDYEMVVSGHTDNVPIRTAEFDSNWDLSSKRAINFMMILLQNPAYDPKKFSAIGYGEYRPVDSNATADGRAKNRRVEVSILRKYTDPATEETTLTVTASAGQTTQTQTQAQTQAQAAN